MMAPIKPSHLHCCLTSLSCCPLFPLLCVVVSWHPIFMLSFCCSSALPLVRHPLHVLMLLVCSLHCCSLLQWCWVMCCHFSAPPLTPTSSGLQAGGSAVDVVLAVVRNKTHCYPASSGSQQQQQLSIIKRTTEPERKGKTVSRSNDEKSIIKNLPTAQMTLVIILAQFAMSGLVLALALAVVCVCVDWCWHQHSVALRQCGAGLRN
jgi:hypothetical protein